MNTEPTVLELQALPRVVHQRLPAPPAGTTPPPVPDTVLTVSDFGSQIDKALHRFNAAQYDPWFFRAAEVSTRTRFDAQRSMVHEKLLQLFGLAYLDLLRVKFSLRAGCERVRLSGGAAAGGPVEILDARELLSKQGKHAVQRVRGLCIAGHAADLLARSDYRIAGLIEQAWPRT